MQGYHASQGGQAKKKLSYFLCGIGKPVLLVPGATSMPPRNLQFIYKEIHKVFLLETGTKETVYTFKNYSMKRRDTSIM